MGGKHKRGKHKLLMGLVAIRAYVSSMPWGLTNFTNEVSMGT